MKKFALIGAAGYIAFKHLQAIKDVGGELVAALDPHDSVGILDRYFKETQFFTNEYTFQRFLIQNEVDYVSICSPNYLHYNHILLALNSRAKAICEKPLVINPDNLEDLKCRNAVTNKIFPILQLRKHPSVLEIQKTWILKGNNNGHNVNLFYQTYRGPWYQQSWKGDKTKSGGIAYNLGIHLFDLLIHLFGPLNKFQIGVKDDKELSGKLGLKYADATFYLTTKFTDIRREISIDGVKYNLNFEDEDNLHSECYRDILDGRGLTISDVEPALQLAYKIENGE